MFKQDQFVKGLGLGFALAGLIYAAGLIFGLPQKTLQFGALFFLGLGVVLSVLGFAMTPNQTRRKVSRSTEPLSKGETVSRLSKPEKRVIVTQASKPMEEPASSAIDLKGKKTKKVIEVQTNTHELKKIIDDMAKRPIDPDTQTQANREDLLALDLTESRIDIQIKNLK